MRTFAAWLCALALISGCDRPPSSDSQPPAATRTAADAPNILWVVWDTVRADHMSLHGHARPTTPNLDEWAKTARVYDDCISPSSITICSHASMFTGLSTSEHGANNARIFLEDQFETIAEILARAGYRTYCYSANANVSRDLNLTQGFELVEHPWSPKYIERAIEIVRKKTEGDDSSELGGKLRQLAPNKQDVKASGELAVPAVEDWLKATDSRKPYFVFVNWMEAHRQLIPPRRLRERFMTPAQVEKSFKVDRSWTSTWEYTLGVREMSDEDIELTRLTYDAALLELDELFDLLLTRLRAAGALENTIVIVTSDHGEHLGEHHMLDHQFSVYDVLLRVPLIVHYPAKFAPGRESRPVMTHDLFPTLLEIIGLPAPEKTASAISLLHPAEARDRLAGYPTPFTEGLSLVKRRNKDFDFKPWNRGLRAFQSGEFKLIAGTDKRDELYNLKLDPGELQNLIAGQPEIAKRLHEQLEAHLRLLTPFKSTGQRIPTISPDVQMQRNFGGYTGEDDAE